MALLKRGGRRSGLPLSPFLAALLAAVAVAVTTVAGAAPARSPEPAAEYKLKAAFLFNFTKFVDWPPEAFADDRSPFTLCVLGEDPFGTSLDDVVANEVVANRPIVIRRRTRGADLRTCQILFLPRTEREHQAEILAGLRGTSVLSVGEADGFLTEGGVINFFLEANRIRFEINLPAAERTKLKISSKLLRLAKVTER